MKIVRSAFLFLLYRVLEILMEISAEWVVISDEGGREGDSRVVKPTKLGFNCLGPNPRSVIYLEQT